MTDRTRSRVLAAAATALLALAGGAACSTATRPAPTRTGSTWSPPSTPSSSSPSGSAATRSRVTNLAKPGAEPHDLELNPRQVGQVSRRRAGRLPQGLPAGGGRGRRAERRRPGVRRGHASQPLLDASAGGHDHDRARTGTPRRAAARTRTSGSTRPGWPPSPTSSPSGSARPTRPTPPTTPPAAAALRADLDDAGRASTPPGLATCQRREIVTSHAAFGYLADRYRLDQIGITGLSPDAEPSPQRLRRGRQRGPEHRRHHDLLRDAGQPEGRRDHRRARSARRPPCWTRSKGSPTGATATTFRSCAPTWPR